MAGARTPFGSPSRRSRRPTSTPTGTASEENAPFARSGFSVSTRRCGLLASRIAALFMVSTSPGSWSTEKCSRISPFTSRLRLRRSCKKPEPRWPDLRPARARSQIYAASIKLAAAPSVPISKFASFCGTLVCPHARERTSGSKDTSQLYASSAAFEFEVPKRMCRNMIGLQIRRTSERAQTRTTPARGRDDGA